MKHKSIKYFVIVILVIILYSVGIIGYIQWTKRLPTTGENVDHTINTTTGLLHEQEVEHMEQIIKIMSSDDGMIIYYTKQEMINLITQFHESNKKITDEYYYIMNFEYEEVKYPIFKDEEHKQIDLEQTELVYNKLINRLEENATYHLQPDSTNDKWGLINLLYIEKDNPEHRNEIIHGD